MLDVHSFNQFTLFLRPQNIIWKAIDPTHTYAHLISTSKTARCQAKCL